MHLEMSSAKWQPVYWGHNVWTRNFSFGTNRAESRFAPSQWETVLLCNNVSHWVGASLESALIMIILPRLHCCYISGPSSNQYVILSSGRLTTFTCPMHSRWIRHVRCSHVAVSSNKTWSMISTMISWWLESAHSAIHLVSQEWSNMLASSR